MPRGSNSEAAPSEAVTESCRAVETAWPTKVKTDRPQNAMVCPTSVRQFHLGQLLDRCQILPRGDRQAHAGALGIARRLVEDLQHRLRQLHLAGRSMALSPRTKATRKLP